MAVQTKEQILSLLQEQHHYIHAFGVHRLGLVGSFLREQQGRESDVDMLVEFAPGRKTFDAFMQLAFFLEALFGRRVELVTPGDCLREPILRFTLCTAGSMPSNNAKRLLSCCFAVTEHL